MKKAVQFGAGNIGRGFIGQLCYESGYHVTYVDVVKDVIDGLNARGEYPLRIVADEPYTVTIREVSGVYATDVPAVASVLAEADLAATAVGAPILPRIAPTIAAGIAKRFENAEAPPLDFIVCENMIGAGPYLREQVRGHLDAKYHRFLDERVGFVEASIGRMVPVMTPEKRAEDPLIIWVEPYCELPVDANGFKGPVPALKNLLAKGNFGAYVERKIFVHNCSHAVAAYLGYLRGYEYIWEAVEDQEINELIHAAARETCEGLARKHNLDRVELDAHRQDIIRRFRNKGLGDQVTRVAKDPIRKLGPNDRLIGAGLMCLEQGVEPAHVAFAAAAGIRYDYAEDPAAQEVQRIRREQGVEGVFAQICQLPPESPLAKLILTADERLRREGWVK